MLNIWMPKGWDTKNGTCSIGDVSGIVATEGPRKLGLATIKKPNKLTPITKKGPRELAPITLKAINYGKNLAVRRSNCPVDTTSQPDGTCLMLDKSQSDQQTVTTPTRIQKKSLSQGMSKIRVRRLAAKNAQTHLTIQDIQKALDDPNFVEQGWFQDWYCYFLNESGDRICDGWSGKTIPRDDESGPFHYHKN